MANREEAPSYFAGFFGGGGREDLAATFGGTGSGMSLVFGNRPPQRQPAPVHRFFPRHRTSGESNPGERLLLIAVVAQEISVLGAECHAGSLQRSEPLLRVSAAAIGASLPAGQCSGRESWFLILKQRGAERFWLAHYFTGGQMPRVNPHVCSADAPVDFCSVDAGVWGCIGRLTGAG